MGRFHRWCTGLFLGQGYPWFAMAENSVNGVSVSTCQTGSGSDADPCVATVPPCAALGCREMWSKVQAVGCRVPQQRGTAQAAAITRLVPFCAAFVPWALQSSPSHSTIGDSTVPALLFRIRSGMRWLGHGCQNVAFATVLFQWRGRWNWHRCFVRSSGCGHVLTCR